jgi:hypothetical protein
LVDRVTQRWVQITGRSLEKINETENSWLEGPVGKPQGVGKTFFDDLAGELGLEVKRNGTRHGLVQNFQLLSGPEFDSGRVHSSVAEFYECTSDFSMDVWSEWCGAFRPFGKLLAILFSRRLQQLNLPLDALDSSRGVTSEVIQLIDPKSGEARFTGWLRRLLETGNVLYAGSYSLCRVPNYPNPCVKVVFPLPNGNAIVIMKPAVGPNGSLTLTSSGMAFGDPGFYFTVHADDGRVRARYLRALRESIHVYPGETGSVRADHILRLFGLVFLRLHYRLQSVSVKTTNEMRTP